jgi:hypothetical protein
MVQQSQIKGKNMTDKDKTAIELIYEIHTMLTNMSNRLDMLEKNVLLLNDKANGKMFEAINREMPQGKTATSEAVQGMRPIPGPTTISPDRLAALSEPAAAPAAPRQENVRVFGKFADQRKKPILGVEVTILDANNQVVKQTKTNKSGEFNSFLPPGQYSAEFVKENMAPQFRIFEIRPGQKEVEVM